MTKDEAPQPLGLRTREAAHLLGVSERTLWGLTKAGAIPHTRVGRSVIYPRRLLEQWLNERAEKGGAH
jgi:excisionase family DNA binding protein